MTGFAERTNGTEMTDTEKLVFLFERLKRFADREQTPYLSEFESGFKMGQTDLANELLSDLAQASF